MKKLIAHTSLRSFQLFLSGMEGDYVKLCFFLCNFSFFLCGSDTKPDLFLLHCKMAIREKSTTPPQVYM